MICNHWLHLRRTPLLTGLAILALAGPVIVGCSSSDSSDSDGGTATTATESAATGADDDPAPPPNPYLAGSVWPATHNGSYAQGSSELPGPTDDQVDAVRTIVPGVPVIVSFSPPYPDGSIVAWTTTTNTPDRRGVVKLDPTTGEIIDTIVPADEGLTVPANVALLSGAYNMVDRDNHVIVAYATRYEVYGDAEPGDPRSEIALLGTYDLPSSAFCRPDDTLIGQTMTYDGQIAFVTDMGMVGFLPRTPEEMNAKGTVVTSLNGDRCGDGSIPTEELEHVTNNIASDERGGIYVVSDERMLRFDIVDGAIDATWSSPYETGTELSVVRLGGDGSGSTPSLMGRSDDTDSFVVVTDGQDLMHLVLFWRGDIPADWEPIAPGKDPRIACEIAVTFGDDGATNTESEQSVLVHGYSSYLTNNRLENSDEIAQLDARLRNGAAALSGGDPAVAPKGAERIDWDPETRTCETVWTNSTVSMPNSVPTMSGASDTVYALGLQGETWGLIGLDDETGEQTLFVAGPGGADCAEAQLDQFTDAVHGVFGPYFERLPASCDNSFYAATEVGPDGTIYNGNFGALTRYVPR